MTKLIIVRNGYYYSFRLACFVFYPLLSFALYHWASSLDYNRTFIRNLILSQCLILPAFIYGWFWNSITTPYQIHLNHELIILKRKFLQYHLSDINLLWDDLSIILYRPWKSLTSKKYYYLTILPKSNKKITFHCNYEIVREVYELYKDSANPVWRFGELK